MSSKRRMPKNKAPPPVAPARVKKSSPESKSSPSSNSNEQKPQTASGLDQEAEDQFELELCWCVQQLEAALADKKLQDKQIFNMSKSLNVLKSNNASFIKKRQVMRNTFGDYRMKMAEDEKKFAKVSATLKFVAPTNNSKLEKKSVFLRKARSSTDEGSLKCLSEQFGGKVSIGSDVAAKVPFQFNFPLVES
ncbi:UPF0488 protein CG14286 [Copidosoma floridanum]|uniref:UPF0488 protein CG14286 n=1 Tax=Copidosoma floridanum TaxID=29053 RepID=UPI0006C97B47|nr:UPF0488 protein CG14286 [Copidosoma floridanum]XP_023247223.1 UPF0488 protein CG14286 [Copidosoma floridanum]